MADKVFFESQIQRRKDETFVMHVTISRYDNCWTSAPVLLDAATWAEAQVVGQTAFNALCMALTEED